MLSKLLTKCVLLTGALTLVSTTSLAAYPERPVRLLVPYAAGGPTDFLARTFGERLSKELGQTVVVENKPGANSIVAVNAMMQSKPDGYTVLFAGLATVVLNKYLYKNLSYNPDTDLIPVGVISSMPLVMVVSKDLPAKTVPEFVEYAKKQKDKLNFGIPGIGNPLHLSPLIFAKESGIELESIPYNQGGTGQALLTLMSGEIHTVFDVVQSALPHIKSGKLRPLAVTTAERNKALPDVPTFQELGYKGYDAKAWFALTAPKGTPQDIVNALHDATAKVVSDPSFAPPLENLGLLPFPAMTFSEIDQYIQNENQRWGTVIKDNNISLD